MSCGTRRECRRKHLVALRFSRSGCGTCSRGLTKTRLRPWILVPVGFVAFLRVTLSCTAKECRRAPCCCCCTCCVRRTTTLLLSCRLIRVLLKFLILVVVKSFRLLLVDEYLVRLNCIDWNCRDSQHRVSVHLLCYCTCFVTTMTKQFWKMSSARAMQLLQLQRPLGSCSMKDCTGSAVNDDRVDLGTCWNKNKHEMSERQTNNSEIYVYQVSISSTFYEQLLRQYSCDKNFLCLQFSVVIFQRKIIGAKTACKMLVKLTPVMNNSC